jgi:hypothetical protein
VADRQARRRTQREIREGRAPRRLAERSSDQHLQELQALRWQCGGVYLVRRLALAAVVLFLVIASTIVHSDEYSPTSFSPPVGPYVGAGWGSRCFII